MTVRSFLLINEYGQEYGMNSADLTGLFTEPGGLGYEYTVNYIDIGDAFIRTKKKAKQGVITGTMIFGGRAPYELYNKFNEFVRGSQEIRIAYQTPGSKRAYYRDVDLVKLEKTEIADGVLQCPVKFYCKSLFYSNVQNNFTVSTIEGELRYTVAWPARYKDVYKRQVYTGVNQLDIELYTDKKDLEAERKVEAVLKKHGFFYERTETYLESEKMYEVLFETEVLTNGK